MDIQEKLIFFENNLSKIFTQQDIEVGYIGECLTDKEVVNILKAWPPEIKILIVDYFLNSNTDNKVL